MALADFHYTTGISSGFKVYILEGHSSFENEQRFHRLPAYRLPTCTNKRKASLDVRRIPEGQKGSKVRRLSSRPIAASQDRAATSASVPIAPIAVSCISTSSAAICKDSRGLPASCTQKCPPKEPLLEPALTVTQLQQMRPSVITCAPRRSCPKAPPSPSSPLSPVKRKNGTSNFPHSQRPCPWTTNISASFSRAASPRQTVKEADGNL